MIVGFSRRVLSRRVRICLQAGVLAVTVLYILPKLLCFFWQLHQPGPKIRHEQIIEKPLRVISEFVGDNLVYEKNSKNLLFSTGKERKSDIRC